MDGADDFAENRELDAQGQAQPIRSSVAGVMTPTMQASTQPKSNRMPSSICKGRLSETLRTNAQG
jgi:hypothetical protein